MPQSKCVKRSHNFSSSIASESPSSSLDGGKCRDKRFRVNGAGDVQVDPRSDSKSKKDEQSDALFLRCLSPDRIQQDKHGHLLCKPSDIIHHRYMVMRRLGEGTFGRVIAVRDLRNPSAPQIAMKIIRNKEKYVHAARLEIIILKEIAKKNRPNQHLCVKMLDSFDYHGHICIMFEILGKSVFDIMKENHYHPFPMDQVKYISHQLVRAVEFLHSIKVTHTDLKPENMLFTHNEFTEIDHALPSLNKRLRKIRVMKNAEIRLIDFGSAVFDEEPHGQVVTTRHYRSPEVILDVGWAEPCDVWSVGCIIFELYSGITLFQTHTNADHLAIMERVIGPLPKLIQGTNKTVCAPFYSLTESQRQQVETQIVRENLLPLKQYMRSTTDQETNQETTLLFDLIQRMMKFNPVDRLKMVEALQHPFFMKQPVQVSWLGYPLDNCATVSAGRSSSSRIFEEQPEQQQKGHTTILNL